ncbi:MAG: polysaccharide deacetylase family protein [Candidatus Paceibacterota bacterium]|jgi:peptidoglycan/xylan/chitin deacetylase (PgdA/CDA1 family)
MKKILFCFLIVLIIALVVYLIFIKDKSTEEPLSVNLQITEYDNPVALTKAIEELEKRGIKTATVFVGKQFTEDNCSLVRELDQKGYEIAAVGYAFDDNGEFIQLANMVKEDQEKIIKDTKDVIEGCIGHKIGGFRAQRFSQNKDTNEIVNDAGFSWHGSFVINWHPEASYIPYYSSDYGFYVVSIEGVGKSGYVLCDTAMASYNKTAKEWKDTIQDYFYQHQKDGIPFITEFHPYFLVDKSDWWDEFINILDWLGKQNINYLTVQQFIDSSCPVCGE